LQRCQIISSAISMIRNEHGSGVDKAGTPEPGGGVAWAGLGGSGKAEAPTACGACVYR
jgi:hypothetical protein